VELQALSQQPFELLLALERRARAVLSAVGEGSEASEEWVGIAFRLGTENFVTNRSDVREVLPLPDSLTRVPGAKPWLRGVTNVRGQLMTVVDLRGFLGAGGMMPDRRGRVLVLSSREVPTGLIVDEVFGFRRFSLSEYEDEAPSTVLRCERFLRGAYRHGAEVWPRFDLVTLLDDENFLHAAEKLKA
jgi:twitching motility protein PilI